VLFFPRVVVPLIGLTGGAGPHPGRRGRVQVALAVLPQGMELFA
jgi:hypothetical protein